MGVVESEVEVGISRCMRYVLSELMQVCCMHCIVQPEADGQILTYPMSASLSDAHASFMSGSPYHSSTQRPGPPSFSSVVYGQPDAESEWSLCIIVFMQLLCHRLG